MDKPSSFYSGNLSLLALSTLSAHEGMRARTDFGCLRFLCASTGGCDAQIGSARAHLVGPWSLVLGGDVSYVLVDVQADTHLMQVDVGLGADDCLGYTQADMLSCYPEYRRLWESAEPFFSFQDEYAQVPAAIRSLHVYSLYPPAERRIFTSLSLDYLMLTAATAVEEGLLCSCQGNRHVRKAVTYIHDHYMYPITAADIARSAGIHVGHLHRLFQAVMGIHVGEYLTRLRMEKARTLLLRTDIPLGEIARIVGISTQQYFSRVFKQQTGMTPQQYRHTYNVTCDYAAASRHYSTTLGARPPDVSDGQAAEGGGSA